VPAAEDPPDDGRGLIVFIGDTRTPTSEWAEWAALFDASGYDGIILPGPDGHRPFGPGAVREALRATTRLPILVGHRGGGRVARSLIGRMPLAAVIAIQSRSPHWYTRVRPAVALGRRWPGRVPAVTVSRPPVLLVNGGRGYSLVMDDGWRQVAYFCLDWLTQHDL
jgi:hypothetical protein